MPDPRVEVELGGRWVDLSGIEVPAIELSDDIDGAPVTEYISGLGAHEITFSLNFVPTWPMPWHFDGRLIGEIEEPRPDGTATARITDRRALRAALRPQARRRAARRSRHPLSRGMRRHVRRTKAKGA